MKLVELFITEEKIVQAAFKDPATGKVYPTGQMHDTEVVMKEFGFDPNNDNDWEGFTKIYTPVELTSLVGHAGQRCIVAGSDSFETSRQPHDAVAMTHPDIEQTVALLVLVVLDVTQEL